MRKNKVALESSKNTLLVRQALWKEGDVRI